MPFLPEQLIMVDTELTGVLPESDSLLQLAMIKLKLSDGQYTKVDQPLILYFPFPGKPENDFQKQYLTYIYKKCNQSTLTDQDAVKQIEAFLGEEFLGKATPVGDCIPTDIDFMYRRGLLKRPGYSPSGEKVLGTLHFEFFDLNAIKAISQEKLGYKFEVDGQDPGIHDAYVDCENQLLELNMYLNILLKNAKPKKKQETAMAGLKTGTLKDVDCSISEFKTWCRKTFPKCKLTHEDNVVSMDCEGEANAVLDKYTWCIEYDSFTTDQEKSLKELSKGNVKAQVLGMLSEYKIVVTADGKVNLSDLNKALAADPSLLPPKRWTTKMLKRIKENNPSYDAETVRATMGRIWSDLPASKKQEIRAREGKTYGPAKAS